MRAAQTFQNKPTDHLQNWGTFLTYKQRSCIQFITNEQVKLISFILEGVDYTLGMYVMYLGIRWEYVMYVE